MKTENAVLMREAREALAGNWGIAIGAIVIFNLAHAFQKIPKVGGIVSAIIMGPMTLGLAIFTLKIARKQNVNLNDLFEGFKNIGNSVGAYLLMWLFIILWSLLLVIPGIIAMYSYSMVFYIMSEDPTIGPLDAIRKSKAMMMGNKWKMFLLGLRFLGWFLLSVLTLGIGLLWLMPYMYVTYAKFYDDIKNSVEPVVV